MFAVGLRLRKGSAGKRFGPSCVQTKPTRWQAGFTLVELLVVIAVIGILMAMLLPAVQSARESGRRTTCQANQYQLALASIRYSDSNGFVPGWINGITSTSGGIVNCGWAVVLLPFVERMDVYQTIISNASIPMANIESFACPSMAVSIFTGNSAQPLCYSGNAGTGLNQRIDGVMVNNVHTVAQTPRNSMKTIATADGTASTLLACEKYFPIVGAGSESGMSYPSWAGAPSFIGSGTIAWTSSNTGGSPYVGMAPTTLVALQSGTIKIVNAPRSAVSNAPGVASQPTSAHPGGAVVAFCDGHTAFLKENLQYFVYAQLMIPNNAAVNSTSSATANTWRTDRSNNAYILSDSDYK